MPQCAAVSLHIHDHGTFKEDVQGMLPLVTLLTGLFGVLMLAKAEWTHKFSRTFLLAFVALAQTALVLFELFIMKPPAF